LGHKNNYKKMRYLKKWNIIFEKNGPKCDLETFKEIMFDITDSYHDVTFKQPEDGYYECKFTLFTNVDDIIYDLPRISLDDVIGYIDAPALIDISTENRLIYKTVNDYINNLNDFKKNIDMIIDNYSKINKVFEIMENYILPRFKHFSNFQTCSVGFDEFSGVMIITFETDEYEYEN
jgi:hypothetical protein